MAPPWRSSSVTVTAYEASERRRPSPPPMRAERRAASTSCGSHAACPPSAPCPDASASRSRRDSSAQPGTRTTNQKRSASAASSGSTPRYPLNESSSGGRRVHRRPPVPQVGELDAGDPALVDDREQLVLQVRPAAVDLVEEHELGTPDRPGRADEAQPAGVVGQRDADQVVVVEQRRVVVAEGETQRWRRRARRAASWRCRARRRAAPAPRAPAPPAAPGRDASIPVRRAAPSRTAGRGRSSWSGAAGSCRAVYREISRLA